MIRSQKGEKNNNWKGGKIEIVCTICGKYLKRHPSRICKDRNFCSNKCVGEYNKTAQKGENHWNWKGGFSKCKDCGTQLKDHRSTYCMFCARIGSRGANWQGGISFEPYSIKFNNRLKEQIRKRDNYRCQECFRHQGELFTENGRRYKLMVHHVDYDKKNNNPKNLISLCNNCHGQTGFKREDWIKYFQNKLCLQEKISNLIV